MKNKWIKFRSSYFFRQQKRFSSKNSSEQTPEVVKPESVIEDILRWADDGGKMLPLNSWVHPATAPEQANVLSMKEAEEEVFWK